MTTTSIPTISPTAPSRPPTPTQKSPQAWDSPTTTTTTTASGPSSDSESTTTSSTTTAGSSASGMIRHHSRPPRSVRQTSTRFSSTLNHYSSLRDSPSVRGATVSVVGLGGRRSHVYGGEIVVPGFGYGLGEVDRRGGGKSGGGGGGRGGNGGGGGAAADDDTGWDFIDAGERNDIDDRYGALVEDRRIPEEKTVQSAPDRNDHSQMESCLSFSFDFEEGGGKRADEWAEVTISALLDLDRSTGVEREKHGQRDWDWNERQGKDRSVKPSRSKRGVPDLSVCLSQRGDVSGAGWQPGTNRIGRNGGMRAVLGKGAPPGAQISFTPGDIVVVGNRFWF